MTNSEAIEQLKSESEQSAIQCTHGYDKRQNEIGETLIYCEHTDNWMNVTLGECLGNCEAEESEAERNKLQRMQGNMAYAEI